MRNRQIGIGVVGSGRIGTLRAHMAARHPAVNFLAVSDASPERASDLGGRVGADCVSGNNSEVILHPQVQAVFVSTPEHDHRAAVIEALEAGKAVFVEKPIALSMEDARAMETAAKKAGGALHVGYSRRHERRWMLTKEQILQGRLGEILGIQSRVYNSRAQMLEILKRSPEATPVLDVLTYYVDLACWYLEGLRPVEVVARSKSKIFQAMGYSASDITWAIITFENGAVVNLGVCYALPARYPSVGQSSRFEIIGDEGVILLDADNKDSFLFTDKGAPHSYVPDHVISAMFMQTTSAADYAVGTYWGAVADETRAWLDHVVTGRAVPHATAAEASLTLEITLAIEKSAKTGEPVRLSGSE
jgi:predicted dehydrogenase